MKKYKIGIVGRTPLGNYGHQLDQTFINHPSAEIVAIADIDSDAREKCKQRTNAKKTYGDYKTMLAREKLDIIVVAPRYTDCHEEMVLSALEAGCHVYCEKPISQDLKQVDQIIKKSEDKKLKVGVALPFIHETRCKLLKEMIQNNTIGKIIRLKAFCKHDHRGGGQDFGILGPHFTEIMRYLAGDPLWGHGSVTYNGKKIDSQDIKAGDEGLGPIAGDNIFAFYQFKDGITGTMETAKLNIKERPEQPYRLEIYGEKGIVYVKAPYADHSIWYYPKPFINPTQNLWEQIETDIVPTYGDYHKLASIDFIKSIEEDRNPLCNIYEAKKSLEMTLMPYYSTLNKTRIQFPIKLKDHPLMDRLTV